MEDGKAYSQGICGSQWIPVTSIAEGNPNGSEWVPTPPFINTGNGNGTSECPEEVLRQFNYVRRTEPCVCVNYQTDENGVLVDDNPTVEHRPAPSTPEIRSEQRICICLHKPIPDKLTVIEKCAPPPRPKQIEKRVDRPLCPPCHPIVICEKPPEHFSRQCTVLVPTRPLPTTTLTHVHQSPRPPPDIRIDRWCPPEKRLVVIPPSGLDCPPLHNIVVIYEPPPQHIIPKVEVGGIEETDPQGYPLNHCATVVEKNMLHNEISRILRSEKIDEDMIQRVLRDIEDKTAAACRR